MSTDRKRIQFVCVRAAHHRSVTPQKVVCEHYGCDAFCPAGDVGDHEWLPTTTDLVGLGCLGYVRYADDGAPAEEPREPAPA